jgi:uncharacterized protein
MRIAITGASGLIGRELCRAYTAQGYSITRVLRPVMDRSAQPGVVLWDPARQELDAAGLEGHDAIINLAGANLADKRWTPAVKQQLIDSRVIPARLLAQALTRLQRPPSVLINASAVGYYGSQPHAVEVEESGAAGGDFLAQLVHDWEEAAQGAAASGVRVVLARFGVALSAQGGALAKMLPVFRAGLGGRLGNGQQSFSWIALSELAPALQHIIEHETISGPVNLTAPGAVNNAEFTLELARALHRPALAVVPAFALRAILGEMAEMLLSGVRAVPKKLLESGYKFKQPSLRQAMEELLA